MECAFSQLRKDRIRNYSALLARLVELKELITLRLVFGVASLGLLVKLVLDTGLLKQKPGRGSFFLPENLCLLNKLAQLVCRL